MYNIEDYPDNTAALAAGLSIGSLYSTEGVLKIVIHEEDAEYPTDHKALLEWIQERRNKRIKERKNM